MENTSTSIKKLTKNKTAKPRFLEEMKAVLEDPSVIEKIGPKKIIYDVYREIDLVDNVFRYDLTYLHPIMLGKELPKTFGHCHNELEIMEVISGKILWLLQKHNDKNPKIIEEAYLIKAEKGEKAIFPSGFGAISINPTKETTILSNWININTQSNYNFSKELHGSCYYVLDNQKIVKNENYEKVPELVELKPKELPEFGITFDKPLLEMKENKKNLEFIKNTEKYKNILTIDKCFTKL